MVIEIRANLSPNTAKLEERDRYFTYLKGLIVTHREMNAGRPVVLMGHSMGNRCIQYFLTWIKRKEGQKWIDENIHAFLALGAPFLGAPKAMRTAVSGDSMELEMFLTQEEAKYMTRRSASLPWLFPLNEDMYPDVLGRLNMDEKAEEERVSSERGSGDREKEKEKEKGGGGGGGGGERVSVGLEKVLQKGAPLALQYYRSFYVTDSLFLSKRDDDECPSVFQRPPVNRLWCVYGVNLPTEVSYYFKASSRGLHLDASADKYSKKKVSIVNPRGFTISGGVAFESRDTYQPTIRETKSGDGTVPFCSLNYPSVWMKEEKERRRRKRKRMKEKGTEEREEEREREFCVLNFEIDGAEHRDMLTNEGVFDVVIDLVCERPPCV